MAGPAAFLSIYLYGYTQKIIGSPWGKEHDDDDVYNSVSLIVFFTMRK